MPEKTDLPSKKTIPYTLIFIVSGSLLFLLSIYYILSQSPTNRAQLVNSPEEDQNVNTLTIHGSTNLGQTLLPELVKKWLESNDVNDVEVSTSQQETIITYYTKAETMGKVYVKAVGSKNALFETEEFPNTGLYDGHCDIGMLSRKIRDEEREKFIAKGLGKMNSSRTQIPLARDAMIIAVHEANGVSQISLQQVARIFAGQITNWEELGGNDLAIKPIMRQPQSASNVFFRQRVMSIYGVSADESYPRLRNDKAIADLIAKEPGSIGYISKAQVRSDTVALALRGCNECSPVKPSAVTIKSKEYPLVRTMYLYAPEVKRSEIAENFLQFIMTPKGMGSVVEPGFEKYGGTSVSKTEEELYKNELFSNTNNPPLVRSLGKDWNRAKTAVSIRYDPNKNNIYWESKHHLERIFMHLKGELKDHEVMLVGHSCSSLGVEARGDSKTRLTKLKELFTEQEIPNVTTTNLNTKYMISEPKSLVGRALNRRIDIWVRPQVVETE